ncbi:MAG: 16S rRNA (guanine(527)-N(7))-methyltransferase RsmG [Chitinophagales bacterium]|nr:16S rRNA (guanine(527)-N(7))-methyltransferase RsmG [Chitinophagales bacterium]
MGIELLLKHFPQLDAKQQAQFAQLPELYTEWNAKINVISRSDIDNLMERHVLHSLALARVISFKPGAKILDLGCGGGFPGIPMAIFYPETHFTLIDATGKKIKVVQEVAQALGLTNVTAIHGRVEELKTPGAYDFVISRAVAPLVKLMFWSHRLISKKHQHAYPNGLIALKGGDLRAEIRELPGKGKDYTEIFPIRGYFKTEFFEEKSVVYVQA